MMMTVINMDKHTKALTDLEKNQMPFITSVALNETVKQIAGTRQKPGFLAKTIDRYVDKGANPYTKGGFYWYGSSKRNLVAYVGAKKNNHYLDTIIFGGTVKPLKNNKTLIQPVGQRLNKYGNIPRNTIDRMKNRPNYFLGKPKNSNKPYGLYKTYKTKRKPQLMILMKNKRRSQRGFFPAPMLSRMFIRKQFDKNFKIAFTNIMMRGSYFPTGF